ncbi:hypothetical protein IV203_033315 [Nitzschia inconspicua]|uniref:Uncharacterized protein n=1 Tax=Nitzschia inconspicua TaxID=303405 RepID=A0A9K3KL69_9STRA|nr:hypothetical protein IV203_033315 [Nitzschia inconspicua]
MKVRELVKETKVSPRRRCGGGNVTEVPFMSFPEGAHVAPSFASIASLSSSLISSKPLLPNRSSSLRGIVGMVMLIGMIQIVWVFHTTNIIQTQSEAFHVATDSMIYNIPSRNMQHQSTTIILPQNRSVTISTLSKEKSRTTHKNSSVMTSAMAKKNQKLGGNHRKGAKNKKNRRNHKMGAKQNHHDHPVQHRCAINMFGLPRSFRDHVLPSLVENVIKVNARHDCDYFVHYYNKTEESSSRSGIGGSIDPNDVLLLRQAVHQVYQSMNTTSYLPRVHFVSDTDDDFYQARNDTIFFIDEMPKRHNLTENPYYTTRSGYDHNTLINILKMWHSQTKVFQLMEATGKKATTARTSKTSKSSSPYYTRVAMLRIDVIYMTPIDVFRVPNDLAPKRYDIFNTDLGASWYHPLEGPINRSDYYFQDDKNTHVVIPGFASHPINDRMIIGPYKAVKMWATERWNLHPHYITLIQKRHYLKRFGLHDERFLSHLLMPLMRRKFKVPIMVDRNLYFLRVRADGSIWILDSPFRNPRWREPKLLQKLLNRTCSSFRTKVKFSPWQAKCTTDGPTKDEEDDNKMDNKKKKTTKKKMKETKRNEKKTGKKMKIG